MSVDPKSSQDIQILNYEGLGINTHYISHTKMSGNCM